jgi:hypothetical protein
MAIQKVAYEFDPFELIGLDAPKDRSTRREALEEIADYVRTEILQYVGDAKSPVKGGAWKASLSPAYAKLKAEISGSSKANMELTGDMLDAMECVITSRGTLELRIKGAEAAKADGHNNFSGDSSLPAREFIPNEDKGQTFKQPILNGMKQIARAFIDEED